MKSLQSGIMLGWFALNLAAADAGWHTDFSRAQAQAKAGKRLVLLSFTGSDWCAPCKLLHKNVVATEEFKWFARDHLVLVELDFPRSKAQSVEVTGTNRELSRAFDIQGYPTVIVLSSDGRELSRQVNYAGEDAQAYVARRRQLLPK